MKPDVILIAEVKTRSPFGWRSPQSWEELLELAAAYGDMLSIHTDPRWGGSLELVRRARRRTTKPILAKGIHARDQDIVDALAAGADWVLVVGRVPAVHLDKCILEPSSLAELAKLPPTSRAVWNSRDLATGGRKSKTFTQARAIWPGWLCQASNLASIEDVDPTANAILVGSHLPQFIASLTA